MKVTLSSQPPALLDLDALAVPLSSDPVSDPDVLELDRALGGVIQEASASGEHRGRIHEVLPLRLAAGAGPRRLLLYGLGAPRDLDGQRLRYAHHEMVRAARTYGYRRLGVLRGSPLDRGSLDAVVEGCVLGAWERRSRQTGPPQRSTLEELVLAGFGAGREREAARAVELGEASNRAREWQNLPPNELTPAAFAEEAAKIADRHRLEIEVLGPAELRTQGYSLILGVAAGSAEPARLVRLRHRGAAGGPVLALVGKGITFDTGGISIKPAKDMHLMKADMGGAANVLAAMEVIASRGVAADVMAVLAMAENMPGGAAQRPGDVLRSANGKTVEVINTDAEGRLVLADAITHAIRHGATHIVDLATLTGAARTAIGHAASAAVAGDDELWGNLQEASRRAGDRVWRLPNYPDYRVLLRSQFADLKNADYGEAGAITGAMFIQEFTEGRPWVHLDIAASHWNENTLLTTVPRGPTGAACRLLVHLAELIAGELSPALPG
ncbi:MAG: leucyl aminopeptidase family protein [Candidatus Dormibacteraceae bacterium]